MKTLLLIDENEASRRRLLPVFEASGWRVLEAADEKTGWDLARECQPEVIVVDLPVKLPDVTYWLRALRSEAPLRNVKCVVRSLGSTAVAGDSLLVPEWTEAHLLAALESLGADQAPGAAPVSETAGNQQVATTFKFWGVRGSIPTPGADTVFFGGNTSCVEVRAGGEIIILDAGSGIRPLGLALAAEFGPAPIRINLLISHTHWDHIQGFPFFLPAYDSKNELRVLGFEGARDGLRATLVGQMESPYFPVALHQMPSRLVIGELKDMRFSMGPIQAQACFTNHPGVCAGYRLATPGGVLVYMPDNETFLRDGRRANGSPVPSPLERNICAFIRDADVLIADTQYTAAEYDRHVGWGHGCLDEVVRLAIGANVKRLFLFHHDPSHDDRFVAGMLAQARELASALGSAMKIDAAREGEQFEMSPVAAAS
jgi:phosphoribosyl 1,2-cyclic phosphodiesterase/CheY-like chemotaxis protein